MGEEKYKILDEDKKETVGSGLDSLLNAFHEIEDISKKRKDREISIAMTDTIISQLFMIRAILQTDLDTASIAKKNLPDILKAINKMEVEMKDVMKDEEEESE